MTKGGLAGSFIIIGGRLVHGKFFYLATKLNGRLHLTFVLLLLRIVSKRIIMQHRSTVLEKTQTIQLQSCERFERVFVRGNASASWSYATDRNSQPCKPYRGSMYLGVRGSSHIGHVRFAERPCVLTRSLARNGTGSSVSTTPA